jgi:PPOX class probable F420-dependent enzyme
VTDQPYTDSFEVLDGHRFMNLTSFYQAARGVTTPVWFAEMAGKLYVISDATTYKVRRIRVVSDVEVGPSDPMGKLLGPVVKAQARILDDQVDAQLIEQALKALAKKYGLMFRIFNLMGRLRKTGRAMIEVGL